MDASQPTTSHQPSEWETFVLETEHELRLETGQKEGVAIKLAASGSGSAEVFGTELAPEVEYSIQPNTKLAIFSYTGCRILVRGSPLVSYTAGETPMASYLNVHLALEGARRDASSFSTSTNLLKGPRVLVVGPSDVGKSSLCKILLNYSVKLGHKQVYADIDCTEVGGLSMPGSISASVFSRVVDVEEGMGGTLVSTGTSPIVFYYGYGEPLERPKLYSKLVDRLAQVVEAKTQNDAKVRSAGVIVNTPAQFSESAGYGLLTQAVTAFNISIVLVLGHERLYSDLTRQFQGSKEVTVLKLAKSGGVVSRDKAFRRAVEGARVREYFYGTPRFPLSPFSNTVKFDDLAVRRVGDNVTAPSSIMPIGYDRKAAETKVVRVDDANILLNSVLALTHADRLGALLALSGGATSAPALTSEQETQLVLDRNVAGFVYVSEVDERKGKVTLLAPYPGKLPQKYLLMGALKWVETV
ncbi:protein CLP1 [Chytriomyces sp. MP71]|nr:protein CLP1 [Chytriomyces sp. MP71]